MPRRLTEQDVDRVRETAVAAIAEQMRARSTRSDAYAFDPGILAFIGTQVVIPILVSLTTDKLKEVLKGKDLATTSEDEVAEITNELVGRPVADTPELTPEAFAALAEQLRPMGFSDAAIAEVFLKAQRSLADG
jgi:hypothetical protein